VVRIPPLAGGGVERARYGRVRPGLKGQREKRRSGGSKDGWREEPRTYKTNDKNVNESMMKKIKSATKEIQRKKRRAHLLLMAGECMIFSMPGVATCGFFE